MRGGGGVGFPALHRAGLIEAEHETQGDRPAGLFPALHRAGLIEAKRRAARKKRR